MKRLSVEADIERVQKLYRYEQEFRAEGYNLIAGVDEAGRGSLIGSVIVAAVILPENLYLEHLNDSKKLSAKVREILYDKIISEAISWSIVSVSMEEVDTLNVYQASLLGMKRAVESLDVQPEVVLTDAMKVNFGEKIRTRAIIHGDRLSASIAAASILAKVSRDRLTDKWASEYPEYGFERNRGYATKEHIDAINKFGACPIHRRSFNPVKTLLKK